ncbi:MAG: methyltransferase [Bacteroidales bacterium]|nr:methyltransferase [Bacteroidales bacterium]
MSNSFFKFKQFIVDHSDCAMKVGTDGVLIGAWCYKDCRADNEKANITSDVCKELKFENAMFNVLDIGTGSGLISLMIAQRFENAKIDAVEIDLDAFSCAKNNFFNSPWKERLNVINSSIEDFIPINNSSQNGNIDILEAACAELNNKSGSREQKKYDLIVSNPPYFENSLKSDCNKRTKARHTDSLSYETLIRKSASLLASQGILSLIYPYEADGKIEALCKENLLFCKRKSFVKGNPNSPIKRVLAEFSFSDSEFVLISDTFSIEIERQHYTNEYISLTKDFYLKM